MLWYKAWLETRWRFAFLLGCTAALMLLPYSLKAPQNRWWVAFEIQTAAVGCIAGIYLAGSGINTQTLYSATSGFHGSMLFTLSLPVSRKRLLFVRAALGAAETCLVVLLNEWLALHFRPDATSFTQALRYGVRALVCTMAVYALSVFVACVLDEMWQFTGVGLVLVAVWFVQLRSALVAYFSPLRGMSLISYPITSGMPWPPLLTSTVAIVAFLWLSVLVVERREY
jgi:hypothetical protein